MIIGDRLRALREEKKLSQGDIEKRTGLLRCYISRVENGHTVPAIETLEKLARALECPLYQLFYDGEEPPQLPNLPKRKSSDDIAWGSVGKDARFLNKLRRLVESVHLYRRCPRRCRQTICAWADSVIAAVLHRHKRVDRVGTREREPVFRAFRWPGLYGHSQRGICNNEVTPFAFRCRPGRVSFLRGVREGGRQ